MFIQYTNAYNGTISEGSMISKKDTDELITPGANERFQVFVSRQQPSLFVIDVTIRATLTL